MKRRGIDLPQIATRFTSSYTPYGSNAEAFNSTSKEVLLSGAAGTGKTRAWLEKIHALMQAYPGARGLIMRATRSSLSNTVLVTFEDHVLGANHPLYTGGAKRRNRQTYYYPNGSEIDVAGMDKPEKVLSSEYDIIYVAEAVELEEAQWETLTTRLRNNKAPHQQLVADTNPSFPTHWLKKRCDDGKTQMIFARHEDNPRLFDPKRGAWTPEGASYLATLDELSGVLRDRFMLGKWVQAEGAVYDGFDESVHVVEPFTIPPHWTRYRSIDFGYNNPFVCLWAAEDSDGRLYIYREIYQTRQIVEDHATLINALGADEQYTMTIADHDAEDRATLERYNVHSSPADKEVKSGIEAVQARLRIQHDGKPRLMFFRGAIEDRRDDYLDKRKLPACTVEEFPAYVWQKTPDGRTNKEAPVKQFDHGMDALRYLIKTIESRPAWEGIIA